MKILDNDKLNGVSLGTVGQCCVAVADAVQDWKKEEQVVGSAIFFLLLCKVFNADAKEVFNTAERIIRYRHTDRVEIAAAEDYIRGELLG